MKNFIVHNAEGKILRTGRCQESALRTQAKIGEFVIEGEADDLTQKVVDGEVVDKTPEEVELDNPTPPEVPFEKLSAYITNEQWQDVLNRLSKLEAEA